MATENKPVAASDKSAAEYQKTGQEAADKASGTPAKKAAPKSAADVRADRGTPAGDGGGVAAELRESYERRVGDLDGVDARLDNRRGKDRPKKEEWPAKPQQIDGPDITQQAEWTRRVLSEREDRDGGEKMGMRSEGMHGLGYAESDKAEASFDKDEK